MPQSVIVVAPSFFIILPALFALGGLVGGVVVFLRRRKDPSLVRLYLIAMIGGIITLVFILGQLRPSTHG
ncbi:MAG TPA: hypothetical protein VH370_18135 [Humisphaera sp.]|jgi:hypothetical protein|nr:hypothetical protein [Humisphaera sp.]